MFTCARYLADVISGDAHMGNVGEPSDFVKGMHMNKIKSKNPVPEFVQPSGLVFPIIPGLRVKNSF